MPLNGNSSARQPRRWWVTGLAILAAVILLAAFVTRKDDSIPVRPAQGERGHIRSLISKKGKIEPVQNFEAHSPLTTTVRRVLVKEGDAVKKGQLLVTLDDADARTQAARAQTQMKIAAAEINALERGGNQEEVLSVDAQMVKARGDRDAALRNLEAMKRLQQQQTGRYSKPEIARVDAQRREAQAVYDAAQDALSKSNVRAPFAGIVYSLPVKQGAFVTSGDLLLQVADLRKVQVRAFVDEPDVGKLAPGNSMEITWDAVPGRIWRSTVNGIPSTVKLRGSRNVGETISIVDNKDMKLLPNVNVGVTIVTAERNGALVVPREAVRMDDSKPYVLQVVGRQLKRKDVETSISNLTEVEITRGLALNDMVAISSLNGKPIGDGTQVKY